MSQRKAYFYFLTSMLIFGSIGLFSRWISLPSAQIVWVRTIIGTLFLLLIFRWKHQTPNLTAMRRQLPLLALAGGVMGLSWIALFEAYRYTTIGVATLLYYCAPILTFLAAPFVLKESLSRAKIFGILAAVGGMALVNQVEIGGTDPAFGVLCGAISAVLYATLMLCNQKFSGLTGLEITLGQFIAAFLTVSVYLICTGNLIRVLPSPREILLLLFVGIVNTAIACYLYFSSMQSIPVQSVALLCYLDPLSALFFSFTILQEQLSPLQLVGAALIFGGTACGQLFGSRKTE